MSSSIYDRTIGVNDPLLNDLPGIGIPVADATTRNAMYSLWLASPFPLLDSQVVHQLDNDTYWAWNANSTSWTQLSIGSSSVTGPGTTVVNHVPIWTDITGNSLGETGVTIDPSTGAIVTPGSITSATFPVPVGPAITVLNHVATWGGTGGGSLLETPVTIDPSTGAMVDPSTVTASDFISPALTLQKSSFTTAVCLGDSLTFGLGGGLNPYPTVLSKLLNMPVLNLGVPSQTSTQCAMRFGGVTANVTVVGGSIPTSGGVVVTFPSGYEPVTDYGPNYLYCEILGVEGKLTWANPTFTFTRSVPGPAVSAPSPTPFTALGLAPLKSLFILWIGYNNHTFPAQVVSDTEACIAKIVANGGNYIILSVLNGDSAAQWIGGAEYTDIVTDINAVLQAAHPDNFYDARAWLVSNYDPGTPQDVTDHGHDVPPSTLRSDTLHLNSTGYWILAQGIKNYMMAGSWRSEMPSINQLLTQVADSNFFEGYGAGSHITTGIYNRLSGYNTGLNLTTGSYDDFSGAYAGLNATSATGCGLRGYFAGINLVDAAFCEYSGYQAGASNVHAYYGTAFGANCFSAATQQGHAGFGYGVAQNMGLGEFVTGGGMYALLSLLTSNGQTTGLGYNCGVNSEVDTSSTWLGAGSGTTTAHSTTSFRTAIGAGSMCDTDNTVAIGRPADQVLLPGGLKADTAMNSHKLTGNALGTADGDLLTIAQVSARITIGV